MAQSVVDGSVAQTVEEEEDEFGPVLIKKLEASAVVLPFRRRIWKF